MHLFFFGSPQVARERRISRNARVVASVSVLRGTSANMPRVRCRRIVPLPLPIAADHRSSSSVLCLILGIATVLVWITQVQAGRQKYFKTSNFF